MAKKKSKARSIAVYEPADDSDDGDQALRDELESEFEKAGIIDKVTISGDGESVDLTAEQGEADHCSDEDAGGWEDEAEPEELRTFARQLRQAGLRRLAAKGVVAAKTLLVEEAKEILRNAKAELREIDDEIGELIADVPDPDRYPLFDRKAGDADGEDDPRPDGEAWKDVPLTLLVEKHGLSPSIVEKLKQVDVATLGDLTTYQTEVPLTTIKGIGDSAVDKIDQATADYWAKNPTPD